MTEEPSNAIQSKIPILYTCGSYRIERTTNSHFILDITIRTLWELKLDWKHAISSAGSDSGDRSSIKVTHHKKTWFFAWLNSGTHDKQMKDKPVVSSVWCIQTFDAHLSNWAIRIGDDARNIRGKTFENREKDNFEDWKSSGISIIKRGLDFVVPNLRSKKSSELHKKT